MSTKKVCALGAAALDLYAAPYSPLVRGDSVPGRVGFIFGGVARNISENLARLQQNVTLFTAVGNDLFSKLFLEDTAKLGINLEHIFIDQNGVMSSYCATNNEYGEMQWAVADFAVCERVTPDFIASKMKFVNSCDVCVCDTAFTQDTIEFLARNCTAPLFVDTVSRKKAVRMKNVLHFIHTIKTNKLELGALVGENIDSLDEIKTATKHLLSEGIKNVFVTLDKDGVYFANAQESGVLHSFCEKIVNTTGAGDSFTAALVASFLRGHKDLKTMARLASAAAAFTVASEKSVSEKISYQALEKFAKKKEECK